MGIASSRSVPKFGMARTCRAPGLLHKFMSHWQSFCVALSCQGVQCFNCHTKKMLIFHANLGPNMGGPNWYIGPLIMLLPFLLGSGILTVPLNLLSLLLGGALPTTTFYVWDPSTGWQQAQGQAALPAPSWLTFVGPLVLMFLLLGALGLLVRLGRRRNGAFPTLRQLLFTGWQGGGGRRRQQGGQQQQQQGGQRRPAGTQQERFERVTQLVQALPAEVYHSREELEQMPASELKALLRKQGGKGAEGPMEKRELIDTLMSGANSSSTSCSICCEDYAAGDVLRALRCGHRFHLECIDRWLLSSTDYSRPPACPMCNAELGQ